MKTSSKILTALAGIAALLFSTQARAQLQPGDVAPTFQTQAALAGKPFTFDLAQSLRQGPVVLYFYPKAFTKGCTIEANAFAEATPQFRQLGASVVGLSHDNIETLKKFSTEACRDQFAVASDPQARVIKAYRAGSILPGMASRISYVIGTDGRIKFVHKGMDPYQHVELTLKAVRQLKGR